MVRRLPGQAVERRESCRRPSSTHRSNNGRTFLSHRGWPAAVHVGWWCVSFIRMYPSTGMYRSESDNLRRRTFWRVGEGGATTTATTASGDDGEKKWRDTHEPGKGATSHRTSTEHRL